MEPVTVSEGSMPVILTAPHSGLWLPDDILARLNEQGRARADTDWHVDRLYDGLLPGATVIRANFHRYVIDANRDPSGASLYPGQNTTGLCPLTDFHGRSIYQGGAEPGAAEIEARRRTYHAPYHDAIAVQIKRVLALHGYAILYDCHSIASEIPYLFDGKLPDLNIGANDGKSCDSAMQDAIAALCEKQSEYAYVVNGRFKGGWTTRHYGNPEQNIHAIQMELAQSTYMIERPPWTYDQAKAERLRALLRQILETLGATARPLKIRKRPGNVALRS